MRPLALIACALLLAAGTARADLVLGGATDAGAYADDVRVGDGIAPQLVQVCLGQGVPPAECARRCELGQLHALYGADYVPDAGAFAARACAELVGMDAGAPIDAGQPDAGTDVPVQLVAGQPAPGPGWWLSDQQAAAVVHESQARAQVLQHPPEVDGGAGMSATEAAMIGAATFAAGVAAGVYLHQRATH